MLLSLYVGDRSLQSACQVNVEQRSVQTLNDGQLAPGCLIRTCRADLLLERVTALRRRCGLASFNIILTSDAELSLVFSISSSGRAVRTSQVGDTENRFPWRDADGRIDLWRAVPKSSGCESALGPSVIDASKVPVDGVGRGITIKLIANVDQVLYRSKIYVVYRREVEDNGFQGRSVICGVNLLATASARVIPWTVLRRSLALIMRFQTEIELTPMRP